MLTKKSRGKKHELVNHQDIFFFFRCIVMMFDILHMHKLASRLISFLDEIG
jgi:hypothetical protein